jgi:hypothetical protein
MIIGRYKLRPLPAYSPWLLVDALVIQTIGNIRMETKHTRVSEAQIPLDAGAHGLHGCN